ncbi:TPA: acetolactate synthase large subunit [Candidatus Woesearchaeota archaeon]|nr:acetolactate synthase large subunit [Candidatus Woesearchaeota archaeon]
MKASDLFVKCLEAEEVEYIFGLPGEENIDLLDSLSRSKIKFINCRHEQGAAFMAAIYGRLTGKAGVCLSTLGPGALNLMTAVADANLGHAPLVAITGQAGVHRKHKENFQFVDIVKAFEPITKWNTSIYIASVIPEVIRKAFKVAEMEKPGATHIELPEDVAKHDVNGTPFQKNRVRRPSADAKALDMAAELIRQSKFPLILSGNGSMRTRVSNQLREFVEQLGIHAVQTQMGKGALGAKNKYSLLSVFSNTGLHKEDIYYCAFSRADLVITLGYDESEIPASNWNSKKDKKIVHIDFTPSEVEEYYNPTIEVVGDISNTLRALKERLQGEKKKDTKYFFELRKKIVESYDKEEKNTSFPLKPQYILSEVRKQMGNTDILISDVGAHKIWVARNYEAYEPNTCIIDNALASMGVALPGAIAAKLVHPDKKVIAICGDGGFLMNVQELETAKRLGNPFVVVIFNDNKYGMIEWKQHNAFGHSYGIDFTNPDFVKLAESFGLKGVRVNKTADFSKILKKALDDKKNIWIIDAPIDFKENFLLTKKQGNVCPV